MAREEKDLYNPGGTDDDGHSGEKPEEAEDIDEFDDHIMYHNFYGY
ncbi:MAG: hypothetical protein ACOY4I_17550 [Bacillota bacterium]